MEKSEKINECAEKIADQIQQKVMGNSYDSWCRYSDVKSLVETEILKLIVDLK